MANSVDPDLTPRSAMSDLDLHCLLRSGCPNMYSNNGYLIKSTPPPLKIILDSPLCVLKENSYHSSHRRTMAASSSLHIRASTQIRASIVHLLNHLILQNVTVDESPDETVCICGLIRFCVVGICSKIPFRPALLKT